MFARPSQIRNRLFQLHRYRSGVLARSKSQSGSNRNGDPSRAEHESPQISPATLAEFE